MCARHQYRLAWLAPLVMILLLLTSPVWIPVLKVSSIIDKRRQRKAAMLFACVNCGKILGSEALKLADKTEAETVSEFQRQHPDVKFFRRRRTLDAICTACGMRYTFRKDTQTFVIEASWLVRSQSQVPS